MPPPQPRLEARDYIGLGPAAPASYCSSSSASGEAGPHLALRLGLPGCESPGRAEEGVDAALTLGPAPAPTRGGAKRGFADSLDHSASRDPAASAAGGAREEQKGLVGEAGAPPAAKAQVVGWPPVRNYRKNTLAANATKTKAEEHGKSEAGCCYVKVSMDGAPYLRKVDLKTYSSYENLSLELEKMFSCFITAGTEHVVPCVQLLSEDAGDRGNTHTCNHSHVVLASCSIRPSPNSKIGCATCAARVANLLLDCHFICHTSSVPNCSP